VESGDKTPEDSALARFDPADEARVVGVEYRDNDQAVVQVGFPGMAACYFITAYRIAGGWHA